jgi:hypothetical protein
MEPSIELSKTRDFGEIIADSFLFIRQNLKPLVSCFFVFCGFFLLAGAVTGVMQEIKAVTLMNNINTSDGGAGIVTASRFSQFGTEYFLQLLFVLLTYAAIPVTILSFMTLYKEKGNIAPTNEEVWGYFKYYFLKVLGGSIVNSIVLIVGFVFCLIPGIYFYPILGLVFPIMIVENTTYSYAFSMSFKLIKENWWTTFGALFITGLIVYICMAVVSIPFAAAGIWSLMFQPRHHRHVSLSVTSIVLGTIIRQAAHVLYILPFVALTICYFSLTELKHATGLMGRIDQLGDNKADPTAPAEEY